MTRREFGPWAVTAAGIGVVLCLVAWPYTTLCAGAAVVAAVVLALGVRGLIRGPKTRTAPGEQQASPGDRAICGACGFDPYAEKNHRPWCAVFNQPAAPATVTRRHALVFNAITRVLSDSDDHVRLSVRDKAARAVLDALDSDDPDASGQVPEAVRTDPGAPGQQPADQAGPNPDTPRNRIAAALRTALKTQTVPPLTLYGHQASPGIGLTEYDLADVALTELLPELARLRTAEAATARVRALAEGEYYGITGRAFLAALDAPAPAPAEGSSR